MMKWIEIEALVGATKSEPRYKIHPYLLRAAEIVPSMADGCRCRDAGGCFGRHGKPDIFNTNQGSQSTGAAFIGVLPHSGIAISMDGKGAIS